MRKVLKLLGYITAIMIAGFAIVLVLSNYVFTKELYLSCSGTTEYITEKGGYAKTEKKQDQKSLRISLTKYPGGDFHTTINTETDLFVKGGGSDIVHANAQSIMAGKRVSSGTTFVFHGVTFNRITRAVEIETKYGSTENHDAEIVLFKGVCAEVSPL